MAKNGFFVIFSKTVSLDFWSKYDITNVLLMKFPFWKCILLCIFMNSLRSYVTKQKCPNVTCSPPLRPPFSGHSSPKGPLKLCSVTQRLNPCFFDQKLKRGLFKLRSFAQIELSTLYACLQWIMPYKLCPLSKTHSPIHTNPKPGP